MTSVYVCFSFQVCFDLFKSLHNSWIITDNDVGESAGKPVVFTSDCSHAVSVSVVVLSVRRPGAGDMDDSAPAVFETPLRQQHQGE